MENDQGSSLDKYPPSQPPLTNPAPLVEPTPPPVHSELKYVGFWIRLLAALVDSVIITVILRILGVSPKAFFSAFIIALIYNAIMIYMRSATLGKMLVGIRVKAEEGESMTIGKVLMRELVGKILSTVTLLIGFIMAGFTARKRALHDMIAGTLVVYSKPAEPREKRIVIAIAIVLIGMFVI